MLGIKLKYGIKDKDRIHNLPFFNTFKDIKGIIENFNVVNCRK